MQQRREVIDGLIDGFMCDIVNPAIQSSSNGYIVIAKRKLLEPYKSLSEVLKSDLFERAVAILEAKGYNAKTYNHRFHVINNDSPKLENMTESESVHILPVNQQELEDIKKSQHFIIHNSIKRSYNLNKPLVC